MVIFTKENFYPAGHPLKTDVRQEKEKRLLFLSDRMLMHAAHRSA